MNIDWRHVAVAVARADGAFRLLTTPERDALEAAMADEPAPDPLLGFSDVPAALNAPKGGYATPHDPGE